MVGSRRARDPQAAVGRGGPLSSCGVRTSSRGRRWGHETSSAGSRSSMGSRGWSVRWKPRPGVGRRQAAPDAPAYSRGRSVYVGSLKGWSSPPRVVGAHPADVLTSRSIPTGGRSRRATCPAESGSGRPRRDPRRPFEFSRARARPPCVYSRTGQWLAALVVAPNVVRLFDLTSPLAGEVLRLRGPPAAARVTSPSSHPTAGSSRPTNGTSPSGRSGRDTLARWAATSGSWTTWPSRRTAPARVRLRRVGQHAARLVAVGRPRREGAHPPRGSR